MGQIRAEQDQITFHITIDIHPDKSLSCAPGIQTNFILGMVMPGTFQIHTTFAGHYAIEKRAPMLQTNLLVVWFHFVVILVYKGGLCALFAGIPGAARAEKIAAYLNSLHQGRSEQYFLCPSFDPDEPLFDPKKYWQGPIWPQMNWLIYQGLKRYGFNDLRHIVRDDLLTLMSRFGLYEYFDPRKKMINTLTKGYGGNDFSWTSAIALDLIENP